MTDLEQSAMRLREYVANYGVNDSLRIHNAIEGGKELLTVRPNFHYGEWGPWLVDVGLKERTARRWISLADTGLTPAEVRAIGGIDAAIKSSKSAVVAVFKDGYPDLEAAMERVTAGVAEYREGRNLQLTGLCLLRDTSAWNADYQQAYDELMDELREEAAMRKGVAVADR